VSRIPVGAAYVGHTLRGGCAACERVSICAPSTPRSGARLVRQASHGGLQNRIVVIAGGIAHGHEADVSFGVETHAVPEPRSPAQVLDEVAWWVAALAKTAEANFDLLAACCDRSHCLSGTLRQEASAVQFPVSQVSTEKPEGLLSAGPTSWSGPCRQMACW
jgi:hypothetical protein